MPTKPILLTVDDDPNVLHAIERDLRQKYGGQADSGATALEALKQVKAPS
jgi:thioredoxin reductase (NADPH)